jgi:prepilin-type N-terminal cleavage/methylation domain-containing protein
MKKGYTLTELMAVVAISGILIAVGVPVLNTVNQNIIMAKTRLTLQQDARTSMSLITRVLKEATASSIVITRHNSSQMFYSKIKFSTIDGKNYEFYQDGKNLVMKDGNLTRVLSSDLRYLAFTLTESSDLYIVSISMTLERYLFGGKRKALHMASEKVMVMND